MLHTPKRLAVPPGSTGEFLKRKPTGCGEVLRMEQKPLTPAEKLQLAFEMHDFGVRMMREKLRREHPEESDAEIAHRLRHWLQDRPPDCPGPPWPHPL